MYSNEYIRKFIILTYIVSLADASDFSQQDVTVESVFAELNGVVDEEYSVDLTALDTPHFGDRSRIEIQPKIPEFEGSMFIVDVWLPPRDYFLSDNDVLRVATGTAVEVVKRIFSNPIVDYVRVMQQMDVGEDDPRKAVQIEMAREDYEDIDWSIAKERIKENPESVFEIFGPCKVYERMYEYERPEGAECLT